MALGGTALKLGQTFLYTLAFCCAVIILGLYSYFLATQSQHNVPIPQWEKAVEGISGAGVLYTIFAVILTCFLGGKPFFAFLAVVLDVLFTAGFIAIAVMTRHGSSCSNDQVQTPLGDGPRDSHKGRDGAIYTPSLATACRLNTVSMAVAIIGAFIFLISAFVQVFLGRHHQKQNRYGPSPANNYTKGNGIRFFKRRRGARSAHAAATKDAEAGTFGTGVVAADPTHHNTGSYVGNKYEAEPAYTGHHTGVLNGHNSTVPVAGGYHTGPAGSAVNPYGYDNKAAAHNNF